MPEPYPARGIPVLNGIWAIASYLDDPITQDFIIYAKNLFRKDKILEVGSIYVNLVLELIKITKTLITANDLYARHLNILYNRALECCKKKDRLTLYQANFSYEKTLKSK